MPMEKTFDASARETALYAAWEKAGCFRAGANARPEASTYCIMLPPPNVTGVLHVGHAFSQTLMDILIRWKRMQGFDTLWQPGLDHAGIATQLMVEKDLAERQMPKRTDMGREEFLKHVWEWKQNSGGIIEQQARRMGHSMDWTRSAFTMSGAETAPEGEKPGNFHDAVIQVFVKMYNDELIYRGKRLVNWDPHFETAISDLEVENEEVAGHMWHFKYPLAGGATYEYVEKDEDGNVTLRETRDYISIATTRPETMLGDGAVAVNPKDERYAPIVGKLCEIPVGPKEHRRLIPIITDPYPDPDFGSGAVKITGAHDFNDYEVAKRGNIPMYSLMDTKGAMRADGKPYAEEAAVAQRIANGEEGFDEAKIAAMNLVPDEYRGLDRFEARKLVVEHITAEGNAVMVANPALKDAPSSSGSTGGSPATDSTPSPSSSGSTGGSPDQKIPGQAGDDDIPALIPYVENKPIMQPFGDRSKVVIEPMLTDQWFVETSKIVGPALDAVKEGRTKIMPESGEKVYYHWLENIEPWCISRQLWWGHQIPVWYGPLKSEGMTELSRNGRHLHKIFCATSEAEVQSQVEEYYGEGTVANFVRDAQTQPDGQIEKADPVLEYWDSSFQEVDLTRDPDVLDTWFSSGLWPFGTLGWPDEHDPAMKYFPGNVLVTGQDILFFWVARMMMMSQAVLDEDPFQTVYLHQLVRDEKGQKMSKTKGNVIDPLDMVDQYGADALRFSNAAMAALGGVLKISEDRIKGYRNFGTKLWNACRFAEMNGVFDADGMCIECASDVHGLKPVNAWIIGETARVREEVDAALEAYRFNDAASALYAFVWGRVCDWYVELSKPLLMDGSDAEKQETQRVMRWTLEQCLTLLHPIMPFITEELWALFGHKDFLMLTDWPTYGTDLVNAEAEAELRWTITMIEGIRSARAQMNVPAGLQVPVIELESDTHATKARIENEAMIKRLARIDSIEKGAAPKGALTVATPGATFALPLADIIDVGAEKARISKNIGKLEKEIGGLNGRLNNPKFAASAPPEVVEEAKENLRLRTEERDQMAAALSRLNEID